MADEDDDSAEGGVRTFWSGTITFGLVNVPVALFPATRPRSISMRMVAPDGGTVQRRYVCSKDGEALDNGEIVRGYEIEKDKYVVVTDDELEAIEPRKSREIDLRLFVNRHEIDPIYFERAYFLVPAGGSTKAYRLLAEVMEKSGRAGIATFVMRATEYLIAILAENGILRAETLRFHDEIRTPDDVGLPEPKKTRPADVKKFEKAIADNAGKVDDHDFLDRRAERVEKLVAKKLRLGEDIIEALAAEGNEEGGAEVIDLLAALNKSLAQSGGRKSPRRAERKPAATTASKRRPAPAKKR